MHKTDDPNLPPPSVLDALDQPRRVQLHDPSVKALLAQWKKRGRLIEYGDLNRVAALIRVENPSARTRRKIVAAVEAAGIEIQNNDAWHRTIRETRWRGRLNALGVRRIVQESMRRWPERWDERRRQQRETCVRVRRGLLEYILERERLKPGDEILPWLDWEERWL